MVQHRYQRYDAALAQSLHQNVSKGKYVMHHIQHSSCAHTYSIPHKCVAPASPIPPNRDELYVAALFMKVQHCDAPETALELAHLYKTGESALPQNLQKAFQWYLFAAKKGCPIAMFEVATCLYFGHGIPINFQHAFKWFSKSAQSEEHNERHISSQLMIGQMYYAGESVTKIVARLLKYF